MSDSSPSARAGVAALERAERPLRILHLTAGSDAGGLSRYIHDLSVAMIERGHEVEVAGERGAWHWLFEKSPIPWIDLPLKQGPIALMRSASELRKRLRERPVDVVHCHYRRPTLVARMLQAMGVRGRGGSNGMMVGRGPRLPVLYTLHLSHLSLSWGRRWVSDFGDHTHVASVEALDWMLADARVPRERISVIPHGVHVSAWPLTGPAERSAARRELDLEDDARVAVYVGRLDQRHPKNCPWLLDLAAAWGGRSPELRVLLAGEGPDAPELQSRIDREGLSDRVRLLGHQSPLRVYQAADLMLLPSGREGFSLVCAEAMSCGLPVLRTRTSGTRDLIVEGVNGASVPVDHDAFIAMAIELLSDPARLAVLRGPAAEHIREHFTFDRQLRETTALYERLATPAPSHPPPGPNPAAER